MVVGDNPFDWEKNLRRLSFAYNTSIHPTTGFSPFALMFGRQARIPMDIIPGTAAPLSTTVPQYVTDLHKNLEAAYAYVREQMGHQLLQQNTQYDTKSQGQPFESGELVWLHSPATPRGKCRKLHRPWIGPFRVVSRLSDTVYRLQDTRCCRRRPKVHFNRLKPCSPSVPLPPRVHQQEQPQPTHDPCPPVGVGLELLDEDQEAAPPVTAQSPQQSNSTAGEARDTVIPSSQRSSSPSPCPDRHYPRRTRKAPSGSILPSTIEFEDKFQSERGAV